MSFQLNVPPSVTNKMAQVTEEQPEDGEEPQETGKKREDWRKLKELEEARKAGTAPAMQDEEGRDINPHIPQYIMQAPWYFGATQPTLKHQRNQEENQREFSTGWYKKGVKDTAATKYRKGACENCGAVTHTKKDCLERPRKIGAKFTGKDFAPDEYIQTDLAFDYDGKRDRWNGYDTAEHKRIVEEYQKLDEAKRMLKAQRVEDAVQKGEIAPEEAKKVVEEEDEEDEDKYADDVDMPGQKFESKQRITVRNLRIREDTAKYLYNLNVNSAYYDPKTRSMRENPFQATGKQAKDLPYAGDNFVRWTGGAMEMAKQQLFAWEAYEKGSDVNLQADPTKLDMLTREYAKKKEEYKKSTKDGIMDKYGGQEHLEAPPKHLLMAQSEEYVEYSRHGNILKGAEKNKVKSRYEEDVYTNNHTNVWGSFWKDGQWGFKCCHSFIRESYCTGSAGQQAEQTSVLGVTSEPSTSALSPPVSEKVVSMPTLAIMPAQQKSDEEPEELTERQIRKLKKKEKKKRKKQKEKEKRRKKKKRRHSSSDSESSSSDSGSESEVDEATKRERRIVEAIRKEEERLMEVEKMMTVDERKRAYNVTYNLKGPTDEEIEAYQMKRKRDDDPMAQFM